MNNFLKGVIAQLERDHTQATELVTSCDSRLRAAIQKQREVGNALSEYKQQAAVEERIEEIGIRTQTIDLATRTLVRCEQSKRLRDGSLRIGDSYGRIRAFVKHGNFNKFFHAPVNHKELHILGWCETIMCHDLAEKSVPLAADLAFEISRIRDEIANEGEGHG